VHDKILWKKVFVVFLSCCKNQKSVGGNSFMLQKSKKCLLQFFHVAKSKEVSAIFMPCCMLQKAKISCQKAIRMLHDKFH
jgi:hypothetical protein